MIVQDRKGFPLVNAIFYKSARFQQIWVENRSRTLLCSLLMDDGKELALANVHLDTCYGAVDDKQRTSQLSSALTRLATRRCSFQIVCGDFNDEVATGSSLRVMLENHGLSQVASTGPTFATKNGSKPTTLDQIWSCEALRPCQVLSSSSVDMCAIKQSGLPTSLYPSDHLPVAAIFRINETCLHVSIDPPVQVHEAVRHAWLQVLRMAPVSCFSADTKAAKREQRRAESAFLDSCPEHAEDLRAWRAATCSAAEVLVKSVALKSVSAVLALQRKSELIFDPSEKNAMLLGGG
jgi:hypothetical protein